MMPPGCNMRARGDLVVACLIGTLFAFGYNKVLTHLLIFSLTYLFLALMLCCKNSFKDRSRFAIVITLNFNPEKMARHKCFTSLKISEFYQIVVKLKSKTNKPKSFFQSKGCETLRYSYKHCSDARPHRLHEATMLILVGF